MDKRVKDSLGEYRGIKQYVRGKISRLGAEEKSFSTLYRFMFSERKNIFAESSDGFRIKEITYGECADGIDRISAALKVRLAHLPKGEIVGLYMENSVLWIQVFWSILRCGYRPLLLNLRMDMRLIENIIAGYGVAAVVSDGKQFAVDTVFSDELATAQTTAPAPEAWADEVIFTSSGTTDNVKLCVYTAENFYYQICDSINILEKCPQIKKHYEGRMKLLAFLPLYHVFGFIAVYLWFGFFSRTFVFLKDNHPQTLLNTVRRHKVTHIYSVPLMWETIYKEACKTIRARGERTEKKFRRGLKLSKSLGAGFRKLAFKEVRENIFGESIQFLISGGSAISSEVLTFFNGIGYHLADGYGMTEIGITSLEISNKQKYLNGGSVGYPFHHTEYGISASGELLVRGKTTASRVLVNGQAQPTGQDGWFATGDLAEMRKGRYYILGRKDDLIVGANGENINPILVEKDFSVEGCTNVCLIADKAGDPVLIAQIEACFSAERMRKISADISAALMKLQVIAKKIVLTTDKLIEGNDFKISRKKLAERYEAGKLRVVDLDDPEGFVEHALSELEENVRLCFAEALSLRVEEISLDGNFFTDYGGSSLDYFALVDKLARFGIDLNSKESTPATVREICAGYQNN
ncbi:MAG: non-ribosomal peptide synthetase [Clostridia bacterium]|nr:non-ribosomal peptide synthetase [Clostridia bacterium]